MPADLKRMEQIADFTASLVTTFAAVFVVCLFVSRKLFCKFLLLNLYLLLSPISAAVRFVLLDRLGAASNCYRYSFFVGEMLMMTFLFLTICELSWRLFDGEIPFRKIIIWGSVTFGFAVLLSFRSLEFQHWENVTVFCWTLSQNLFYLCCFAIVLLWAWRLGHVPENRIAVQFLNVLMVYFLVTLFLYMPSSTTVAFHSVNNLCVMLTAWLPLGCGFTLASYHQPQKADI
jgi:hypothetical protein